MSFATVEDAVADIGAGKMVVVVDDEDRENEGDLVMAAEAVTAEALNFMETHARGMKCVPLTVERLQALDLPLMVDRNTARLGTAYAVTVDARQGTTTGISCRDQVVTIKTLIDPAAKPSDLLRPGHVRPLRAAPGGVLVRAGHTEAAVDLAHLAGLSAAAILCEIKREDGEMARLPELTAFCDEHDFPLLTIADLIRHRRRTEKIVERVATTRLSTEYGEFLAHAFRSHV